MNWEEVGAIGQMLGSIAVFITLGYLAVQLRHARAEVRRSVSQTRAAMVREQSMAIAKDTELSGLSARASAALGGPHIPFVVELVSRAGLTVAEASRLQWEQTAWWMIRTEAIRHMDELGKEEQQEFAARLRTVLASGTVDGLWYETSKAALWPDAVRYIDSVLAQPG